MPTPHMETTKNPASRLHVFNLSIAIMAGLISIVGGVYSLKTNVFSPKTGSLQGVVMDERIAKPLTLASVEVSEPGGPVVATATTDSDGRYALGSLREGNYAVKASAFLHPSQTKNVKVYRGAEAHVSFELSPEKPKLSIATELQAAQALSQVPAQVYRQPYPEQLNGSFAPAQQQLSEQTPAAPYLQTQVGEQVANAPYPVSRRSFHPRSRFDSAASSGFPSGSESPAASSGGTSNNVLVQTLGTFVQDWLSSKTGSKS